MKKLLSIVSLMILVAFSLSSATLNSPAATVNLTKTKVISMDTLNSEYEKYVSMGYSVTKLEVLNSLIDDLLISEGAARDGYSVSDSDVEMLYAQQKMNIESSNGITMTDDEFKELVEESYTTVAAYKSYLKTQYTAQQYVSAVKSDMLSDVAEPTDKEIRTFYRQNSSSFMTPERVRLSLITAKKKSDDSTNEKNLETLKDVYAQLQKGTITFEKAVQTYSDDESSKANAGDCGFINDSDAYRSLMGDDFVDAVMNMEAGDLDGVFDTPEYYCIAKCTVHQDAKILTLDDTIENYGVTVYEYIKEGLYYQNAQYAFINAYNSLLSDLRSQAKINIIYKEQ